MIEERREEAERGYIEEDLAYPVCPVIERVADEIAEKYFKAFQYVERDAGGKMLLSLSKMCSNENYSLAVCILQTVLHIQSDEDLKFAFDVLDSCEDSNPGAYGIFFEIFLTDKNIALMMWQGRLAKSIENMN